MLPYTVLCLVMFLMAAMLLVSMTLLVMDEVRARMRTRLRIIVLAASTYDVDCDDHVIMPLRFAWWWSRRHRCEPC